MCSRRRHRSPTLPVLSRNTVRRCAWQQCRRASPCCARRRSAPPRGAKLSDAVRLMDAAPFPTGRPRRLRRTAALRDLVAQTRLHPRELVLPMFVKENLSEPAAIASMPGVVQHTRESLRKAAADAAQAGVGGVMLFGIPSAKDAVGSGATDPDGILNVAIRD